MNKKILIFIEEEIKIIDNHIINLKNDINKTQSKFEEKIERMKNLKKEISILKSALKILNERMR